MTPWEEAAAAAPQASPLPWEEAKAAMGSDEPKTLAGFGKNLIESGKNTLGGLTDFITHGGIAGTILNPVRAVQYGQGLAQYPGKILNEIKHPLDSAYKDPVGFGMDASMVADLGVSAGNVASKIGGEIAKNAAPRLFAKSAGVAERATTEALKNPAVLNNPLPTAADITNHAKNVMDALQEAKQKVGEAHGKVYQRYAGMQGPMQEIVQTPIAQKINPVTTQVPVAQELNKVDIPADLAGNQASAKFTPGNLITEKQVTGYKPGERFTLPNQLNSWNDVLINKQDADLAFKKGDTDALGRLYKEYIGTPKSDIPTSKISNSDKLQILTKLKREASAYGDYFKTSDPNTLVPIDKANSAAAKTVATNINDMRSRLPNGGKLNAADNGWQSINEMYNNLQSGLKTPGTAEDTLYKLYKRDLTGITAGRTAEKLSAIRRLENLSGDKVLQPINDLFTSREFGKWSGKGLSHTMLNATAGGLGGMMGTAAYFAKDPLIGIAGAATGLGALAAGSPKVLGMGIKAGNFLGSRLNRMSNIASPSGRSALIAAILANEAQRNKNQGAQ